jgi:hypothetical protein
MTDNQKKVTRRKKAQRVYLSADSLAAIERESFRLSMPMSMVVDLLIRKHLVEAERVQ